MSDHELTRLLERAVDQAPPINVTTEDILEASRGRVRRRRTTAAGMGVGALALAGAIWLGLGNAGGLTGSADLEPASISWEQDLSIDQVVLRTGTVGVDGWTSPDWTGRLLRTGDGPSHLQLTKDGVPYGQAVEAQRGPGAAEIFRTDEITVALWPLPAGAEPGSVASWSGDYAVASSVSTDLPGGQRVEAAWALTPGGDQVELTEVYLHGSSDVVALSGARPESVVLRAGGEEQLVFLDTDRRVAGAFAQERGTDTTMPLTSAAAAVAYRTGEGGPSQLRAMLPEGAGSVEVTAAEGDEVDVAEAQLGGRVVALAVASRITDDPGAEVPTATVTFELAGTRHELEEYAADLATLDLGGVLTPTEADGQVVLLGSSDLPLHQLGPVAGGAALTVTPTPGATVVTARGWDPGPEVLTAARVQVGDGVSTTWTEPLDVAQFTTADGTPVTLLRLDAPDGLPVAAVGYARGGDVEAWDQAAEVWSPDGAAPAGDAPESFGGVVLQAAADGELAAVRDGQPLQPLDTQLEGTVRAWHDTDGTVVAAAEVLAEGTALEPVLRSADGLLHVRPEAVLDSGGVPVVPADGAASAAGRVLGAVRFSSEETLVGLVRIASWAPFEESVTVVGDGPSGHLSEEGSDPVVAWTEGTDLWLLHRGFDQPAAAGWLGRTVVAVEVGTDTYQLYALLPQVAASGSAGELVADRGVSAGEVGGGMYADGSGPHLWTATVRVPAGADPMEVIQGVDTTGDGVADAELTQVVVPSSG